MADKYEAVLSNVTSEYSSMNDSLGRQIEINEWTYENKLETVFVLQIILLAIVAASILFYFYSFGVLGLGFAIYGTLLVTIISAAIVINRLFYTAARRDPRFWNRRKFGEDRSLLTKYKMNELGWTEYMVRALQEYQAPPKDTTLYTPGSSLGAAAAAAESGVPGAAEKVASMAGSSAAAETAAALASRCPAPPPPRCPTA